MTSITIYRPPTTEIVTVNVDEKTTYVKNLMGEWHITAIFNSSSVLAIQIGDFITHESENYYINRLPDIIKLNNSTFQYKIDFEHSLYNLKKKLFISSDGLAEFSYNGTAEDFITNIVANVNGIDSGWTVGTVDTTNPQTLQFTNESCHAALIRVAEAFSLEWTVVSKAISLIASVGSVRALTFEYGQDKGLYKLTRQQVQDQNILTKIYGFGGTKNISYDYRDRAKRLIFAATGYDPEPASGYPYVTNNIDLYGTIEGQFTDDNIYPQRTSTLTAANIDYDDNDKFNPRASYVEDSAIDFDLNDYLLEGQVAKIVFKSGDLGGVECDIWKYDHTNKRIYFNAYSDADGYTLPYYNSGSPIEPSIGDSYTLVDIAMPQSYIDTAEAALLAATLSFLDENCVPMVVYQCDFDQKYAKAAALSLDTGDKVTVVDSDLGVDALIRIAGIEYPLVNPYKIKAIIADFVPYTLQERIIKNTVSTKKETVFVDLRRAEQARLNTMRQNQMRELLFDTDGYFDPVNIKPLSIETTYLSVGTKSRDFWLSNVTIKANYEGDANAIYVSAGSLIHLQIEIEGLGYTWVIGTPLDQDSLTPATAYYLYAKCSTSALTGEWVLSSSQITVEQVSGYYHFLIGMLFVVADERRDFDFACGMTYINGSTITTGKIQSIDGNNYFDLTQGQFKIGNASASLDWNVTTGDVLTLKGAMVQVAAGTYPVIVFCGAYDSGVTYQKGNQVTYDGSSWNYINETPAAGQTPSEGAYWTEAAVAGADGSDGPGIVYRGEFSASTVYFNNALRRDVVKYSDTYYIFKGTDGTSGEWNAGNWESFGASFSSVATDMLLAEKAYIENLGVRYFEGIPVEAGDLAGTVVNTTANLPDIYKVTLTGTSGTCDIECNGVTKLATWNTSITQTIADFIAANSSNYPGIVLDFTPGNNYFTFTGVITSCSVTMVLPDLHAAQVLHQQTAVKRKNTITLTGEDGQADISCNGGTARIYFNETLANTASGYVEETYSAWAASGVIMSASANDVIAEAATAGLDFTASAAISNVANTYVGNTRIEGNDIWEDSEDSDLGTLKINMKGFNGNATRYRGLYIGNGRQVNQVAIYGSDSYSIGAVAIFADAIFMSSIPGAASGLASNRIYKDGGFLKIT